MRLQKKTEYGLVSLCYIAKQAPLAVVTVRDMVEHEKYSVTYMEKIFQKFRMANIVIAHHGKEGGYSLARHPSEITLRQIIEALEGKTFDVFCEPDIRQKIVCTHFDMCGVRPVWKKTKEVLDNLYGAITLDMMAKGEYESEMSITKAGT